MHVLVLASRKGGVGKTSLSRHLAVEADRRGAGPTALIDTDPQAGLSRWWNRRAAETPAFITTSIQDLSHTLDKLRLGGFGLVVVDTPPAIGATIEAVVSVADLVIVPSRPSPDDLDAIGATVDLVEAADKPVVFVINGATKKARLTGQAAVVLSQHGTVAPVTIHHSVAFPSSAIDGLTVCEADPSGTPAREIADLWTYVADRLAKVDAKPASKAARGLASKQAEKVA